MAHDLEERLAHWRRQLARQDDEWQKAMGALAALGHEPLPVPDSFVESIDRLARPVRTIDLSATALRA